MNHKTVTGYNITLDQALKQGGFYGPTGLWNSLVKIDGLVLRARVETLVIKKDLQQVYMHITNFSKKKYRIPGGSCEKDMPNYIQAMNECNEEARIKVKPSLINTGVHYIKRYKNPYKYDGIRKELSWVGTYTEVYVGEYDGPFTGEVDDRDKDDAMYKYGKFYPISEVYDILSDKHKEVIDDIFPVIKRSEIKEGTDMIYSDDNKSVHYYPYYTPREMAELGVHNESKNKYSDIQDDAIEWYHEYTDTLYNPDSENWLKELQERYDEYMLNPTRETQQLVLNLGWNLFVVPTLENVLMASKRTKEKLRLERERNNDVVITEEMIFTKKDIVLNIDDFDSGKSNILFITGLSGSGKTTMSSELCEQYAATKLSLDYFQNYHSIQNDPRFAKIKASRKNDPMMVWIDKYMKLNPEIKKQSHMFSNIDLVSFKDYFIPFFRWLISELKKDDDRYIIEGLHILLYIPYKDIKKYPLICINTSATKSLVRHWQRDDWTIKDIVQNGYDDILQFKRWNDMYTDFKRSIDESVVIEAAHAYEFGKSQNLYFVSELNMNDELLVPRIPDNYMTRNSFEDNVTPRVCFSATIDGALMDLSQNIKGKKFYVHVPEDGQRLTIIKPAVASVPDQLITHEHWVMENVNLRCIGQIEITGDGDNEYEYTYKKYKYNKTYTTEIPGAKEYKEKLYDWKWRWIWKDDTNLTQENASLLEGFLKSDKDIYYNKDKFDSGEINLCFITGHSGSGKSTMARSMQSAKVEHYELDDLNQNYKFTDDNLKEYGDLIYSFFKGPGKKYRYHSYDDMQNCTNPLDDSGDEFDKCVNRDFVKYAMKYANSHKNTKFVIEGIWLYFFFKPEELKDYAVYIKGTSRVLSAFRAAKRDSKDADTKTKRFIYSIKGTLSTLINKYSIEGEKLINTYRNYYENLQKVNESYIEESSNNKVYHLSQTNLDGKTIQPTVPSNYMTKNGYEDGKTKRVCFATSIDGCLRGLSLKCEGMKLFVHVPDGNYNIYKPSNKEVPDASITGEVWIKKAVKMKCIGQIYVIGDKGEDGIPYKYGDKIAELYDWEWKWIDKFNESYLLQEVSIPEEIPNDIRELLRRLNSYDYGYIKNGQKIKGMKNFFEDYKSLTISEFEKYQIGVCWDYVHYEAYWFAKNKYKYETFYIQVQDEDNDCPSHTYLVFYLPNSSKVYYFESSWGKYQGIEAFDNINKLHNTIRERHIKSARSKCDSKTYFRNKYDAQSPRWEHLSCRDYMAKVSNGRVQVDESSLLEMKRSELDDSEFGLPELRKYPMPDKDHVLSAIRFFNYVSPENEKELARNIKKKMKQYNISPDRVGDKNRLKKYLTEDMDIVMDLLESLQFANFEHTKPALVFDLGSVLVDSKIPFKETLYKSKLIPDDIVEELDAYIGNTYWNNKDKLEYYSEDEFYKYMIDRAPEYLKSYIPAALKLQDSDLRLLDYSKTLIKKLKEKGYKLYYISNWSKWSKDKLTRSGFFDFLKDFDGGIFSGDVGHMKPDNAIFQYFFNKYKEIAPTGCIFFDDRHDNISAAMNIGMYGILFNKLYTVEWIYDNLINGSEE